MRRPTSRLPEINSRLPGLSPRSAISWLGRAASTGLGRRHPFALCYHGVASVAPASDPHGLFLSRRLFAHHVDVIAGEGYELLGVGDLWRRMRAGADGNGLASITFDDALARTAQEAIPLLLERGMSCSVFVPTGLMGRNHPDLEGELILGASEISELAEAGVEIGAHSVDHVFLPALAFDDALDQLKRSRATLEDLLGKPVRTMAYPHGGHTAETERAAVEAGYDVACGCSGPTRWRGLSIPREPVFASASTLRLRLKMAGLYGPVHTLVGNTGGIGRWRARRRGAPARFPRRTRAPASHIIL